MLIDLIDRTGDAAALALAGLVIGLVFGIAAQHSRFCLRAATVEVARGHLGPALAIWLLAFTAAVAAVQGAIAADWLETDRARQLEVENKDMQGRNSEHKVKSIGVPQVLIS